MTLKATPIKTTIFHSGDDLIAFLTKSLRGEELEGKALAITSKIVSLAEERLVPKAEASKQDLVRKEADRYLGAGNHGVELTITRGLLIPSAGIDESNSETGAYILYPKDPYKSAERIWQALQTALGIKNFGIILTDSRSAPLRRGVTGVALSHWGFLGSKSRVGDQDLFHKALQYTHVNVADTLAAAAVLVMGEGSELCPLAIVESAQMEFSEKSSRDELIVAPENDLYAPIFHS